jgi:hypothetical protein
MLDNCTVSSYNFDMDCAFLCCNKIREVFKSFVSVSVLHFC